ncbi:unnamed protein product [Caenorhabditis bovis]|uniref:G-protein coupled receptors family 1 profile domain-containing protein n=1 Tax=Caenorhabditis bovis TaxID=2654633 RepID=A0A8S1EGQ7_9PELO|nr:unnamed protein product [Caenorhabditis bovis]
MGCEMGTVNLTGAEWLESAVASLNASYSHIHPYVSVLLCLAGTAMNIVTVIVLTRPSMRSAVNSLLCAIALCDILVMTSVLVFVTHFLLIAGYRCDPSDYNVYWAYFLYYHSHATVIFHATSIWLTVLLAQIRVFSIRRATSVGGESVSNQSTCLIALATFVSVCLLNIPNLLTFEIIEESSSWLQCKMNESTADTTVFLVSPSEQCALLNIAFWTNGVLFKVVPCVLLTFSIVALVSIIRDVSKRRKNLAQVMNKKRMPRDHTTPMLVAVLSIFLLAELPQGVLHVLNAIFTKETFYLKIYINLGDVMDVLSLLNSAVNFIIYCAMSRKFRAVFIQIFLACLPQSIIRKYAMEPLLDGEISRMRPTDTPLTKSEQLALTSHRDLTIKRYNRYCTTPRVSFDMVRKESRVSNIELIVPQMMTEKDNIFRRLWRFVRPKESEVFSTSPQRRLKLIQCETSTALY